LAYRQNPLVNAVMQERRKLAARKLRLRWSRKRIRQKRRRTK